jgi:teichuronic acid biosynthesis glycosyltransferase TuaG
MAEDRKQALVSIVIPFRNSAAFLTACCNSVIDQTYTHWEAILIDDNSRDESALIAAHFATLDSRFRLIASGRLPQDPAGPWLPRNQGLRVARGQYVAFLDADDLWLQDKLYCQIQLLQKGSYDLCVCSYFRFSDKNRQISERRQPPTGHWPSLLKIMNPIPLSTVVVRRELIRDGFRAVCHEDHDSWQRLFAARKVSYASCEKSLVAYRIHSKSLTGSWWQKLSMRQAMLQTEAGHIRIIGWALFLFIHFIYQLQSLPWRLQRQLIESQGFKMAKPVPFQTGGTSSFRKDGGRRT